MSKSTPNYTRWDTPIQTARGQAVTSVFYINLEHEGFQPGVSNLTFESMGRELKVVILSVCFIIAFSFTFIGIALTTYNETLITHGSVTQATVTACTITRDRYRSHPEFRYSFVVGNATYTGHDSVRDYSTTCSDLPPGTQIDVRYAVSNPNLSRALDPRAVGNVDEALFLNCAILFTGAFFFFALVWSVNYIGQYLWSIRNYPRFRVARQVLEGELLTIRRDGRNPDFITVRYQFVSPIGTVLKGEFTKQRADLRRERLPTQGQRVKVLYVDDQTYLLL